MKLYIKANNKKIVKNLDLLLPKYNTKTATFLDNNSPIEYITNLESANILDNQKEKLFFDNRELKNIINGIYFGNSSCEHLMPTIKDIVEVKEMIKPKKYNFVFVFAPLSEFSFPKAIEILEYLNNFSSEVVVNDFGTLNLALKYKNIKPILGTNFTKSIKKAFDSNIQDDIDILHHLEFEVKEVREFYKGLGVGRISCENLNIDTAFLKQSPYLYLDLYYPYIYISNSKACQIATNFKNEDGTFVNDDCHKYCTQVSCDFKNSKIYNFYQRYNTIYKPNTPLELDANIYKGKKNRLIWEIFL
ncbi:MAG: hypothetical protein DRG78_09715 [Epsilonproteobacteria bacterium]|nr:MAG: hypothetical protein DRG78_09715 [Campylobacterota bacterium]